MNQIRPLVICLFRQGESILVAEGYDENKKEYFFRPWEGASNLVRRAQKLFIGNYWKKSRLRSPIFATYSWWKTSSHSTAKNITRLSWFTMDG